jgi:2-desacetyl-2-hydroxyethyl bacteriochlorophyllide A dehydrogenase
MKCKALFFMAPLKLEIREISLSTLDENQLLVQTLISAISPGTEMLIYRGEAPSELGADEHLPALDGTLAFPLQYGYACVGCVVDVGSKALNDWLGRRVFCFHPHQSLFNISVDQVIPVSEEMPTERVAFLPNVETAINLLHDGTPRLGERVVVFGQGIVGLLTTALLSRQSLDLLAVIEPHALRRKIARESGADLTVPRIDGEGSTALLERLARPPGGADLVYELTGSPEVLNDAIAVAGYDSRIVVGSWYGERRAPIDLGRSFHRNRIRLVSSQVSTISPELRGRWTKPRRMDMALKLLDAVKPERWVTHRFPIERAEDAYKQIDEKPGETIQVLFEYSDT